MNNQPYNNDHENENTVEKTEDKQIPSKEELDAIEYITPIAHKKHKSAHKEDTLTQEKKQEEISGYVFAKPHKKKKKKKSLGVRILIIVLIVLICIPVIALSTWFVFNKVGEKQMHNYDNMVVTPDGNIDELEKVENNGKSITYKGNKYQFNEDIATVVLMGIDKEALGTEDGIVGTGGQADAIYIAAIDTKNEKVSIIGVSRDTMVDINVYNTSGGFINTQNMQICLSYAYGDGKTTSAENTITSLERLFYGIEFSTYFAMDYDALVKLNDAIGGVTVTTDAQFNSTYYGRTIYEGETITLHGNDVNKYIRVRNLSELDSNNARMDRQKQYITSFLSQVIPAAKKDISVVSSLYNTVKSHSVSNLTTSKVTYLATTALSNVESYKDIKFYSIQGTVQKGEKHAEFYVDQNALMELILEVFYTKA